jgi:hypothetical protein
VEKYLPEDYREVGMDQLVFPVGINTEMILERWKIVRENIGTQNGLFIP